MSPNGADVDSVILAGGASSRFGTDKLRAELEGTSLLARVVSVVAPVVDRVVVVGPWAPDGVERVLEPDRFGGPLVALAAGLDEVEAAHVLVLAGDHPVLEPALLRALADRAVAGAADAVVPVARDGRAQPLVACYRRDVRVRIEELLAAGGRSLHALVERLDVELVDERWWAAFDPLGRSLIDVDRPEDLERLRRSIAGGGGGVVEAPDRPPVAAPRADG